MHMYEDKIMDECTNLKKLQQIGLNEFVIDLSNLDAKFVPSMLTKLLNQT